jgi:hypothetical protein
LLLPGLDRAMTAFATDRPALPALAPALAAPPRQAQLTSSRFMSWVGRVLGLSCAITREILRALDIRGL